MDRFINTSIYITYGIIAIISIIISYKVSLVMSLIVLSVESVRMMAIYKRVYVVIILVFILNTMLISYNGYKTQEQIDYNNAGIVKNNEITYKYLNSKDLRASTVKDFKSGIQSLENISIDWWLLVGVYLFLEVSLILLIMGINKEEKQKSKLKKIKKKDRYSGNDKTQENNNEELVLLGSYRCYAKNNNTTVKKAEELFKEWKEENRLVKKNGKNYLIRKGEQVNVHRNNEG